MAKSRDNGHTMCGWPYARARKRGAGLPYRIVNSLVDMPGTMMCERCLPTERAIAIGRHEADMSADEQSFCTARRRYIFTEVKLAKARQHMYVYTHRWRQWVKWWMGMVRQSSAPVDCLHSIDEPIHP